MKTLSNVALVGLVVLSLALAARADTVQLKSGAILVGDVELGASGEIIVTTRFPEEGVFRLRREELAPRSLYDVLERRSDPKDADARLMLGELAERSGLHGRAVSDFLAVAALRPELSKEMDKRIEGVREAIAFDILDEAKDLLERGNPRGALMYFQTLQERYAKTKAAKEAKKLMATSRERAGASVDVAKKTVSDEKAPKLIVALKKDTERGEREVRKLGGHPGRSSRDRKTADRAIRYFEAAWRKTKTLPVAAQNPELRANIQRLRQSGKEQLAKAYLTAGTIHLQAYSIPRAEEYCNKACELTPDEKANHELHRLIIQAKIYGGSGGYGGSGRGTR